MIYKPKNIEELIIYSLQKGSLSTVVLLSKIKEFRHGTTKQAFYQILNKLKASEVVVVRNKIVSLSHIWINKMSEYFEVAKRSYRTQNSPSEDFLQLSDGEKIAYSFNSPAQTDIFWGHAVGILAEFTPRIEPVYLYNPHEWFLLARHESERILFDEIKHKGKKLYLISGHRDLLDKFVAKEFDGEYLQYYMSEKTLFEKENYYFNIFGDFIIEVWIDKNVADEIDKFYKETKGLDDSAQKRIKEIVEQKGKNKFVISRNKRKADKLKSIFKKYFLIRK